MRVTPYELSHLILRFEQEKDMKPMHCVQNLGALRDLVDAYAAIAEKDREIQECDRINYESNESIRKLEAENERMRQALRKLANEAAGFLSFSRILRDRIEEARDFLAEALKEKR